MSIQQTAQITSIEDLLNWITANQRFGIIESLPDSFMLQCPYNSIVTVCFDPDDNIDRIIQKTIERFEDFDADEEFTDLWSREFAERNHITPSQLLSMLSNDQQTLHDIAFALQSRFR